MKCSSFEVTGTIRLQLYKKCTPSWMFSFELHENLQSSFSIGHLWVVTSEGEHHKYNSGLGVLCVEMNNTIEAVTMPVSWLFVFQELRETMEMIMLCVNKNIFYRHPNIELEVVILYSCFAFL